jgi:hypothetical protein
MMYIWLCLFYRLSFALSSPDGPCSAPLEYFKECHSYRTQPVRAGVPAHGPSHPAQESVADFQAPAVCNSMARRV